MKALLTLLPLEPKGHDLRPKVIAFFDRHLKRR